MNFYGNYFFKLKLKILNTVDKIIMNYKLIIIY